MKGWFLEIDHTPPPTHPPHIHFCTPDAVQPALASYWRSQPLAGRLRAICPTLVGYVWFPLVCWIVLRTYGGNNYITIYIIYNFASNWNCKAYLNTFWRLEIYFVVSLKFGGSSAAIFRQFAVCFFLKVDFGNFVPPLLFCPHPSFRAKPPSTALIIYPSKRNFLRLCQLVPEPTPFKLFERNSFDRGRICFLNLIRVEEYNHWTNSYELLLSSTFTQSCYNCRQSTFTITVIKYVSC